MQGSHVSVTLTVCHDGQFWVGASTKAQQALSCQLEATKEDRKASARGTRGGQAGVAWAADPKAQAKASRTPSDPEGSQASAPSMRRSTPPMGR